MKHETLRKSVMVMGTSRGYCYATRVEGEIRLVYNGDVYRWDSASVSSLGVVDKYTPVHNHSGDWVREMGDEMGHVWKRGLLWEQSGFPNLAEAEAALIGNWRRQSDWSYRNPAPGHNDEWLACPPTE